MPDTIRSREALQCHVIRCPSCGTVALVFGPLKPGSSLACELSGCDEVIEVDRIVVPSDDDEVTMTMLLGYC